MPQADAAERAQCAPQPVGAEPAHHAPTADPATIAATSPQADGAKRAHRTPQANAAAQAAVPPQAASADQAQRVPQANAAQAAVPPQAGGAAHRAPEAGLSRGVASGPQGGVADVLVVGGGVIGLVVAWRAAQRGLGVVVADPSPGGGAAHVAAGMLAAVTELQYGEQALLALNRESARRYPDFAAELTALTGVDTGYRRCGTLAVALDADDRAHLRDLHAFQTSLGLEAQWLGGRDCRRLEPLLSPAVRGGLRVDGDHQVDPRRLAAALLRAAGHAGARVVRSSVARITTAGDRVTGALLADGTAVAAGRTVLAAGSESGRFAGLPDAVLPPVRPVKGQILRLRVPASHAPFLSRTVRAVVRGSHVYLVPRTNGELVLGATSEEFGWDTTVTAGGVYELLRDAHELVPGITELPLTETLAGLRPGSPDNAPLLGRTALDGLLMATGHHRNGILLTPVTGDALAHALTAPDGELPSYARAFGAQRFGETAPAGPGRGPGPVRQEQPA